MLLWSAACRRSGAIASVEPHGLNQMSRNIGIGEFLALVIGCSTPPAMSATTVVAWAPGRAHAPAPDRGEHVRLMLEHALRGREPPDDELRRVAVNTWKQFCFHGWTRD